MRPPGVGDEEEMVVRKNERRRPKRAPNKYPLVAAERMAVIPASLQEHYPVLHSHRTLPPHCCLWPSQYVALSHYGGVADSPTCALFQTHRLPSDEIAFDDYRML